MTLQEARKILGLGPNDDPRPLLDDLRAEREHLAALVRSAPNETLALRHQDALVRFDRALAAVRETLEALGLQDKAAAAEQGKDADPVVVAEDVEEEGGEDGSVSSFLRVAAVISLLLISAAVTAFWLHWQYQDHKMMEFEARIESLNATGNDHIENRRWEEAGVVFSEIERLLPGSPIVRRGRERIHEGMAEEQSQFIGYWTGEARAALDSGRLDDAGTAARMVLERFPDQPEAVAVLDEIAGAQLAEIRRRAIAEVAALLDRGEFEAALTAATGLASSHDGDVEIAELVTRARSSLDRLQADHTRARNLLEQARARDTGTFDAEALAWLREASLLAPQDEMIADYLEKMASYTRTIRVPEDVADLQEAIADARGNDRILLGAGTWQGTFVINQPVEVQGAGPEETILECPAIAGCALTLGPQAKGARVSGITFRHLGFDAGEDRYSAALVRGGSVVFADCHFIEASGHGLAVIEGARVEIQRCQLRGNGWNGIAATGEASEASANESSISGNFGHGVEAWSGARLTLVQCRLERNTGNGVHIDTTAAAVRIESCEIAANREFGIVLTAAAAGHVLKNRVTRNQLGGIAVRKAAAAVRLGQNEISTNTGSGLLLDQGLPAADYEDNTIQHNTGSQVMTQADITPPKED